MRCDWLGVGALLVVGAFATAALVLREKVVSHPTARWTMADPGTSDGRRSLRIFTILSSLMALIGWVGAVVMAVVCMTD